MLLNISAMSGTDTGVYRIRILKPVWESRWMVRWEGSHNSGHVTLTLYRFTSQWRSISFKEWLIWHSFNRIKHPLYWTIWPYKDPLPARQTHVYYWISLNPYSVNVSAMNVLKSVLGQCFSHECLRMTHSWPFWADSWHGIIIIKTAWPQKIMTDHVDRSTHD